MFIFIFLSPITSLSISEYVFLLMYFYPEISEIILPFHGLVFNMTFMFVFTNTEEDSYKLELNEICQIYTLIVTFLYVAKSYQKVQCIDAFRK
jgi:hypothetical protein